MELDTSGSLKVGTPLEIASIPVMELQPLAKARRPKMTMAQSNCCFTVASAGKRGACPLIA